MAQKTNYGKLYLSILLLSLATTFLLIISCNENTPNGPEENFGRRDYEWVVDTIDPGDGYYTYGFNLWGAEPNDVWFIGGATTRKDPIWHWDGTRWKNIVLSEFITGLGIWGTSSNNVWMGTSNSSIWHYDGNEWEKFGTYLLEGYDRTLIQSIYGKSENEIYGVGFADKYDGSGFTRIILKYNGTDWSFIELPELEEYLVSVIVDKASGDVLIVSYWLTIPGDTKHVYVLESDSLKEIYSSSGRASIGEIDGNAYVVIDEKIYRYDYGELTLFKDFTDTEYGGRIWGRSETDFFTVNDFWNFGHYNGKDLMNVYKLNATIGQAVVFDKDVFAFGKDIEQPRDFILRGRLKN